MKKNDVEALKAKFGALPLDVVKRFLSEREWYVYEHRVICAPEEREVMRAIGEMYGVSVQVIWKDQVNISRKLSRLLKDEERPTAWIW